MGEDLERLKQRVPLLEYLQRHHWRGHRVGAGPEFAGLCPLHEETHPSFYINARKSLFYCHGCGRGGDLIRFVELSHHLSFRESVAYLQKELAPTAQLLAHTGSERYPSVAEIKQEGERLSSEPQILARFRSVREPRRTVRSTLSHFLPTIASQDSTGRALQE